jgi:hypothetical protein
MQRSSVDIFYLPVSHLCYISTSRMLPKSGYASLAQRDSSQDSKEELVASKDISKSRTRRRRMIILHWLAHVLSALILGLVLIVQTVEPSSARCWKLYNYYCK